MKRIGEVLRLSESFLASKQVPYPRREAEEILSHILGMPRLELYLNTEYPLEEGELERMRGVLKRRGAREPLSYILGEVDFFGSTFAVTPAVLIPRQETELLADLVTNEVEPNKTLLDLCCGSGCLGLSIKKKIPDLKVFLSDLSEEALTLAQHNAKKNSVVAEWFLGDMLDPLKGKRVDYVVCNPPYVSEEEWVDLEPEVKEFEPKLALVGEEKGLAHYSFLAQNLPSFLNPKGKLFLEIGETQGEAVKKFFSDLPWCRARLKKDLAGKERFFFVEIE